MIPKASVPQAVKDRIKNNEALLAAGDKGTPPQDTAQAAPTTASMEPSKEPVATAATQPVETAIKPVTPEAPKPHGTATPEELLKRTSDALSILQRRYNTLESELMAQKQAMEPLKSENAQLSGKIGDFEKQVADLTAQIATAQAKPGEVTKAVVTDFDKKMGEAWGVEPEQMAEYRQSIVDSVMKSLPQPQPAPEPKPAAPIAAKPVTASVQEPTQAQDAGIATYLESLDALVGGSEVRKGIVNDPRFSEFLALQDSGTKKVIHDIATVADKARDAVTMAEIYRAFDQWKRTATDKKPSHLMPTDKGGNGDLNSNKKPVYSQSQVDEFQRKVKAGYYRTIGKSADDAKKLSDEYKNLSDEFSAARQEGEY